MVKTFLYYLKTARPTQWLKNLSVFAALIFSGLFFKPLYFWPVFWTMVIFSLIVSGVYFLNDLIDYQRDKLHPFKRYRPIAQGLIPFPNALVVGLALIFAGFLAAYYLSFPLFLVVFSYVLLQILYSLWLKHLALFDIGSIATGFILRIYAGAVVVNLHMSVWFLICVIAFSLFVAAAKRRSEFVMPEHFNLKQRPVFKYYNLDLLDIYISMFANTTWLSYTIFAYFHSLAVKSEFLPPSLILPRTFYTQKWLMISVPLVIYGVMRYLLLVYRYKEGQSPTRALLKDKPLIIDVVLWFFLVIFILDFHHS